MLCRAVLPPTTGPFLGCPALNKPRPSTPFLLQLIGMSLGLKAALRAMKQPWPSEVSAGLAASTRPTPTYPVDEDKLGQAGVGVLHPAEGVHHLPAAEFLHQLLEAALCSATRTVRGSLCPSPPQWPGPPIHQAFPLPLAAELPWVLPPLAEYLWYCSHPH